MNRGFPPLNLNLPEARPRRGETPRFGPLPPEVLKRRHEIAKALNVRVSQLSRRLRNMSSEERRAVFYKLTMSKGVDAKKTLGGTKLKPVSQPAPNVILAVPQEESLDVLLGKVAEFDQADVERGRLPNDWITSIERIEEAKPKDRLSPELREKYSSLKRRRSLFCEIELLSQSVGKNRQLTELEAWLVDLNNAFANGVHGSLFEYEVAPPICRAVVRCTGEMFRKLVEESRWVERIKQIDSRPAFQPFSQTLEEFRFQNLFPIMNPPDDAPVVCVVDSGVTSGNPFLKPVVIPELSKSFLRKNPEDPNDGYGHGSAVASLAAYHALNLAEDATNEPRVRIANARILDENNKIEDERLLSKVLEEVVRHYTSEGVRIFCLALGDDAKIWEEASKRRLPRQSWVARRLDQLSREFDIVFVTCTGNLLCSEISEFLQERRSYPLYLANSNSRILDPGQAALAITVGSVAPGTKLVHGKGEHRHRTARRALAFHEVRARDLRRTEAGSGRIRR